MMIRHVATTARTKLSALRNTGSHLIDLGLVLAGANGERPQVLAGLARALGPGDAEDHVKLILRSAAGPVIDVEVSDVCAAPEPEWMLMGTRGTLVGTHNRLTWRFVRDDDLPVLDVDPGPASNRDYHVDRPVPHERRWRRTATERAAVAFYRSLYASIRAQAPPPVTAESACRVMSVIEECFHQAVNRATAGDRRGGSPARRS